MRVVVIADFADAGVAVTYVHAVGESGTAALGHPRVEDIGFGLPDVWDQPAAQAARSGIWNGLPVAITLHDYFLACPNGVYYRFDRAEPCTLAPLSVRCVAAPCDPRSYAHKVVRVLGTALTRRAIRGRRLHLVHVSDRGQATIAPFLPDSAIHHRVDNPVAVERGPPAEMRDGARIAFIGRLTREKGADLVAQAAREADLPALFIG